MEPADTFHDNPTSFDRLPHIPNCDCLPCQDAIRPACLLNEPWGNILGVAITNEITLEYHKKRAYRNYMKPVLRREWNTYLKTLHPRALLRASKSHMRDYLNKNLMGFPPKIAPLNYQPSHQDIFYTNPSDVFYKDMTIWDNFGHPSDCKCSFRAKAINHLTSQIIRGI